MQVKLDRKFKKKLSGMFDKYSFEVGILEDKQYRKPLRGERGQKGQDVLSEYAGGPVRKKSNKNSGKKISDVLIANSERLGFNVLSEPFQHPDSDIIKFSREFMRFAFGKSQKKRLENMLQAIVRNPILRGDYGPNGPLTKLIKGFDRAMIDTAQTFKAIKARCVVKKRV